MIYSSINPYLTSILVLIGVSFATFAACGVFFLKLYRISRDSFYLSFCTTCWLLALERIVILIFIGPEQKNAENSPWVYIIRLVAFLILMVAIVKKNRQKNLLP